MTTGGAALPPGGGGITTVPRPLGGGGLVLFGSVASAGFSAGGGCAGAAVGGAWTGVSSQNHAPGGQSWASAGADSPITTAETTVLKQRRIGDSSYVAPYASTSVSPDPRHRAHLGDGRGSFCGFDIARLATRMPPARHPRATCSQPNVTCARPGVHRTPRGHVTAGSHRRQARTGPCPPAARHRSASSPGIGGAAPTPGGICERPRPRRPVWVLC